MHCCWLGRQRTMCRKRWEVSQNRVWPPPNIQQQSKDLHRQAARSCFSTMGGSLDLGSSAQSPQLGAYPSGHCVTLVFQDPKQRIQQRLAAFSTYKHCELISRLCLKSPHLWSIVTQWWKTNPNIFLENFQVCWVQGCCAQHEEYSPYLIT